jgi:starch phosphorylase
MEKNNIDLKTAMEIVPRTMVFTTHTPVAAGHDEFPIDSVRPYLTPFEEKLGIDILALGQAPDSGIDSPLSMFVLAMNLSQYCNGVSELHGAVARRMWAHVWAGRPNDEVPITHITNGVHIASWISIELSLLFERYLGPDWQLHTWNTEMSERVDEIYDEELWRSHEMARSRMIRTCRSHMLKQYGRRNAPRSVMEAAESILDQEVLPSVLLAASPPTNGPPYCCMTRIALKRCSRILPVRFSLSSPAKPTRETTKARS